MTEVFLSRTKLSVLSVPRDSFWLFLLAVAELLYAQADKYSSLEDNDSLTDLDYEDKQSTLSDTDSSWSSVDVSKMRASYGESTASDSDNHYVTQKDTKNGHTDQTDQHQKTPEVNQEVDQNKQLELESGLKQTQAQQQELELDDSGSEFFHVAFTPLECTIMCLEQMMNRYFAQPLRACQQLHMDSVHLVETPFLKLQLDSEGAYDNCTKILDLTEPLSRQNIPLYFLLTHFSNVVLVPYTLKNKVMRTLMHKNFEFSNVSNSYVFNQSPANTPLRELAELDLLHIDDSDSSDNSAMTDLSVQAFRAFKRTNVRPIVDKQTSLLLTGARTGHVGEILEKTARMTLRPTAIPEYFAVTCTAPEEVSLLLPKASRTRASLGFRSKNLMGSVQDIIVPVSLDLHQLPLDTSGIVAGVAGRLFHGVETYAHSVSYPFEMYYLSMARSAIIMVPRDNMKVVGKILNEVDYETL